MPLPPLFAAKAAQTHCLRGHELSPENVKYTPSRPTSRVCCECARIRDRERRPPKRLKVEPRFWSHVDKTASCWLWRLATGRHGYGILQFAGRTWLAHRVAYAFVNGPIAADMTLDHLCRVRSCVNPSHLEVVTRVANIMRGIGVGAVNSRKTHCLKGHPFSGTNLVVRGRRRICRECERDRQRQWRLHRTTTRRS